MTDHANLDAGAIHVVAQWEYANSTARLAATGFVPADVGKFAVETDTYTYYVLSDDSPITWVGVGGAGATAPLTLSAEDAVTNDVTDILIVDHNTSGTPAVGLGTSVAFKAESSTTESQLLGVLKFLWRVVTHATRGSDIILTSVQDGSEAIRAIFAGNATAATTSDGNARGEMANDFQGARWNVADVASGDYSVIAGGSGNQANGYGSFVGGGDSNTADGDYSAIPSGSGNWVPGDYALGIGSGTKADKAAQLAISSGALSAFDAQTSVYHLRRQVTHSTTGWTELQLGPTGIESRITIASNSAWAFEALVVGATSGMAKSFSFHIRGMIENDGGTTTIKGTPTVTVIDDSDDTSFDVRATADDTNDALLIEVSDSDGASDTVRWSARVQTAEIIYS